MNKWVNFMSNNCRTYHFTISFDCLNVNYGQLRPLLWYLFSLSMTWLSFQNNLSNIQYSCLKNVWGQEMIIVLPTYQQHPIFWTFKFIYAYHVSFNFWKCYKYTKDITWSRRIVCQVVPFLWVYDFKIYSNFKSISSYEVHVWF